MDSNRQFVNPIHAIRGYASHEAAIHRLANHTAAPLKSMQSHAAVVTKPANVAVAVVATRAETGGAEATKAANDGAVVIKTAQKIDHGRTLEQSATTTATISTRFAASTALALTFACLTVFLAFFTTTVAISAATALCWLIDR